PPMPAPRGSRARRPGAPASRRTAWIPAPAPSPSALAYRTPAGGTTTPRRSASPRRLEREPTLRTRAIADACAAAEERRSTELAHDLDVDAEGIADPYVVEHVEVVDGGQVAAGVPVVMGREQRTARLRERLEAERGRQPATGDAWIGRAHELDENSRPLADLEHPIEQEKRRRMREPRGLARHAADSSRSGRQTPPRASPFTS